jgi:hypothetical protein
MTEAKGSERDRKGIFLLSGAAAFLAALCCLTPIVLVLLGVSAVAVAADLGNVLYGDYRWEFRAAAFAFLVLALVVYFRRRGVCTLDEARRQRNRIVNVLLLVFIFFVGFYIAWNYIVLQYWGIAVGLPWAQYDESWAFPAAAAVLGAAIALYFILTRRTRRAAAAAALGPSEKSIREH